MLTVQYELESLQSRAYHAMCWCPPLRSVLCIGGAPPLATVLQLFARPPASAARRRNSESYSSTSSESSSDTSLAVATTEQSIHENITVGPTGSVSNTDSASVFLCLTAAELRRGACEQVRVEMLSRSFGDITQESAALQLECPITALTEGVHHPTPSGERRDVLSPNITAAQWRPEEYSWSDDEDEWTRISEDDDAEVRSVTSLEWEAYGKPRGTQTASRYPTEEKRSPLRWHAIRTPSDPRPRYGHQLFYFDHRLYLVGGMYMDEPCAALGDATFDVKRKLWSRLPSPLFPPRFYAAMAARWCDPDDDPDETDTAPTQTLFLFGGVDEMQRETNTLFELCMPSQACAALVQHGAVPSPQYRGVLVADVDVTPHPPTHPSDTDGLSGCVGRLFYMDGYQRGRAMLASLRVYDLRSGFWRRLCSCPNLIGGQLAGLRFGVAAAAAHSPHPQREDVASLRRRRLKQFDIFGGLPPRSPPKETEARTGASRPPGPVETSEEMERSCCLSFTYDVDHEVFHLPHWMPLPRLAHHGVALLPTRLTELLQAAMRRTASRVQQSLRARRAEERAPMRGCGPLPFSGGEPRSLPLPAPQLCGIRPVTSVSFGGTYHDGDATSTVLLLGCRTLPLSEIIRLWMRQRHLAYRAPVATLPDVEPDTTLEDLF